MNTQLVLPEKLSFLKARLSKELQDLKPVKKTHLLTYHPTTTQTELLQDKLSGNITYTIFCS
jgi:hypothetical protein